MKFKALAFVCALLIPLPGLAQAVTEGSFFGSVVDTSGGRVPGAAVTVRHLTMGLTKTVNTDAEGNFAILALPIGPYSVLVTAAGFRNWELARTELTVGDRSRLSPVLEVGELSDTVSVEARSELLQTEQSSVQTVVQTKQIQDLPLAARNVVALAQLVPGIRYTGFGGDERAHNIQGNGSRANTTQFQMDGVNSNGGQDEGGATIPNVDTIAEMSVLTNSFSAESGRGPMQVTIATKSGTNQLRGTLWEFGQSDKLNARNAFALSNPKLRRDQFGGAAGGPIVSDQTFVFGSFETTRIRQETIFNTVTASPEQLTGQFSKTIRDPLTGQPFPNNKIPESRFSTASSFFIPSMLKSNAPNNLFQALAPIKNDTYETVLRVDHQLTNAQRIYVRYVRQNSPSTAYHISPDNVAQNEITGNNAAVNYTWTISPTTVLTSAFGTNRIGKTVFSDRTGKENLSEQAGIQGITTQGREDWIGMPDVAIASYAGLGLPAFAPYHAWANTYNGKVNVTHIRGNHTLALGTEYDDRHQFGRHGSSNVRGTFVFSGQYTGDGLADYLLGLVASTSRNMPLEKYGVDRNPYSGSYVQDTWRARPNLTLQMGLRYERWLAHHSYKGAAATFLPSIGKAVAAMDNGEIDLSAQPTAPYFAEASKDHWVKASDVGLPEGLFVPNGHWGPRLGFTYRPFEKHDVVVRSGYGLYFNSMTANRFGSAIIGVPYWTWETQVFSPSQLVPWERAWPADPSIFLTPAIFTWDPWVKPARTNEWNVSVQTALPFKTALTISYVGTRTDQQFSWTSENDVPPGQYADLQRARPFPYFGGITIVKNNGKVWYDGLQTKLERRFDNGLAFTLAYTFSKHMNDGATDSETTIPVPFAPAGYLRGPSSFDRTHLEFASLIYELPVGRGRKYLSGMNRFADMFLGGWQLSLMQSYSSGTPLSVNTTGNLLGNGYNTRADLVGDPSISDPSPDAWFNTAAFRAPARNTWGNSPLGVVDGPSVFGLDTNIAKNFYVTQSKYFQFRLEAYNALNTVRYGNPGTTLGAATFGRITSALPARQVQLGLKFVF